MAAILFLGEELKDKYAKLYLRKLGYEILDYYIQGSERRFVLNVM